MKLHPDNEELSLLAAIALFTPTRNGISNRDDMFYLESIQVFTIESCHVIVIVPCYLESYGENAQEETQSRPSANATFSRLFNGDR